MMTVDDNFEFSEVVDPVSTPGDMFNDAVEMPLMQGRARPSPSPPPPPPPSPPRIPRV